MVVVIFNFERALVGFSPHRLVTEGVITFNAVICTVLMALGPQVVPTREQIASTVTYGGWIQRAAVFGVVAMLLITLVGWGMTHALYGNQRAPGAGLNVRFGPNATATKAKPTGGQLHP